LIINTNVTVKENNIIAVLLTSIKKCGIKSFGPPPRLLKFTIINFTILYYTLLLSLSIYRTIAAAT